MVDISLGLKIIEKISPELPLAELKLQQINPC